MLKINLKRCLAGVGVAVMLFANTAIGVYAEDPPGDNKESVDNFYTITTGDKTQLELGTNIQDATNAQAKKAGIKLEGNDATSDGSLLPESYKHYTIKDKNGDTYAVTEGTYNSILKLARHQASVYAAAGGGNDELTKAKGEVRAMTDNMNIKSDVATGAMVLSGLQPFIETVLGIAVYILTAGMTVFTVADLCYIFIPTLREKMGEVAQNGGKMSTTSKETGEVKFRFVTDEALYAVQTCTLESGKHPAGVWIKKRIWAYILLGVCLFILLTGNITLIVNIVINIVGGIVNALQSFGA